jgi:hypothetical protein
MKNESNETDSLVTAVLDLPIVPPPKKNRTEQNIALVK